MKIENEHSGGKCKQSSTADFFHKSLLVQMVHLTPVSVYKAFFGHTTSPIDAECHSGDYIEEYLLLSFTNSEAGQLHG